MRRSVLVLAVCFAIVGTLANDFLPHLPKDCSGNPLPCHVGCVRTPGYWSQHQLGDKQEDAIWQYLPDEPICGLTPGQWMDLNTGQTDVPEQLRNLAQQFFAAMLNQYAWSCPFSGCADVDSAFLHAWNILSNPASCTDEQSIYSEWVDILSDFNEGNKCVPSCSGGRIGPSSAPSLSCTPSATQTPSPSTTRTASSTPSSTQTPSSSTTQTASSTPSATRTPSPSQTPSPSSTQTPSSSGTGTPSVSESRTPAPSQSNTPTPSSTRSATPSNSPSASAPATPDASRSGTPTSSPSSIPSASSSPSSPPTTCTVGCTWTQGRWTTHPDEEVMADVQHIVFCGDRTYELCLADNSDKVILNEHWRNLCRQYVAVDLNIRRFDCDEPQPARVAKAYQEAYAILSDEALCDVNDDAWSRLTTTLTDYNEGSFGNKGGPSHCDDVSLSRRRSVDQRQHGEEEDSATLCQECVLDADQLDYVEFDETFMCDMTAQQMIQDTTLPFGAAQVAIVHLNGERCWPPQPTEVQQAYATVAYFLQDSSCSGEMISAEYNESAQRLQDWIDGAYYDLGGPCRCDDQVCQNEKAALSAHHGQPHGESKQDKMATIGASSALAIFGLLTFVSGGCCMLVAVGFSALAIIHSIKKNKHVAQIDDSEQTLLSDNNEEDNNPL